MIKVNTKLNTYILDQGSGYSNQDLDQVEIICYDRKVYVLQYLRRRVLDWYHLYPNQPGGSRISKTNQEVCYWKGLVTQLELYDKLCKICQRFKKRKTIYVNLPPK